MCPGPLHWEKTWKFVPGFLQTYTHVSFPFADNCILSPLYPSKSLNLGVVSGISVAPAIMELTLTREKETRMSL